jgi:hypothetical protein
MAKMTLKMAKMRAKKANTKKIKSSLAADFWPM